MRHGRKMLCLLAVGGLTVLNAASDALATQLETGTVSVTFGGVAKAASPNSYSGKQPDSAKSDGEIESSVERAVKAHKDVSVSVERGLVTLSGQVPVESDREDAVNAAREVPGVRTVHDQIQVTGTKSQSVGEYVDDAGVTAAVKSKLLTEESLSPIAIGVDTINGVVTLTGDVDSKELADRAGDVAGRVKGVKRVDNKLLVKP